MTECRSAGARFRSELRSGRATPASFAATFSAIAPSDRDTWLDAVWDIDDGPVDDVELPRGCVPYLPQV